MKQLSRLKTDKADSTNTEFTVLKITSVETFPVTLPYSLPSKLSFGDFSEGNHLIVKVKTDDEITGYGYAVLNPAISGESQASATDCLHRFSKILVGEEAFNIEAIRIRMDKTVRGNLHAKASVEIALLDILGKYAETPLCNLLGGRLRDNIQVTRVVPLDSPKAMGKIAFKLKEEGYRSLKMKLRGELDDDVERVKTVRSSVGRDTLISVDPNMSYTPKKAIRLISEIERFEIELVEQPIPASDIDGLTQVSKASPIPVMADESVATPEDAYRLAKAGAVDAVSIKIQKMGGIVASKKVAAICEAADMQCVVGTNPSSRINEAANCHLIASTRNLNLPCEVGEFMRMKNDLASGLEVQNGFLKVPSASGLGVKVNL